MLCLLPTILFPQPDSYIPFAMSDNIMSQNIARTYDVCVKATYLAVADQNRMRYNFSARGPGSCAVTRPKDPRTTSIRKNGF